MLHNLALASILVFVKEDKFSATGQCLLIAAVMILYSLYIALFKPFEIDNMPACLIRIALAGATLGYPVV